MNEKYFLALFDENTWNEFLTNGASVYGTTLKRQKRMENTSPCDLLICYVTKISRFVGLLEIVSDAYLDDTRIWESNIYPIRVNVHPIHILKAEFGIPVLNLKDELLMFKNLKSHKSLGAFFRDSLKVIPEHDAKIIIEKLKDASNK